jgi:acyl-coenzyme A thioesterase PaaI-like protein
MARRIAANRGESRLRCAAMTKSLQETHAPQGRCFGCGPRNDKGLRLRSFALDDTQDAHVVCDFVPEPHHEAFEDVLCGGIIGTLLDCHMNWTTIHHLMRKQGLDHAPPCVTAEFKVALKRPTPMGPVHIDAHVVSAAGDRASIEAILTAAGKITAIGTGTFVAVKPDHPAYHRW